MKIVDLAQGTPEWHAHRAAHWNASDAPAMLGVSPYKTRAQLLRELATGIRPEVDAATQRLFDAGHHFEALARPYAEAIIGEELYPCVGVEGRYSASFDGITLMHDVVFEHKTLNDSIRDAVTHSGADGLPEHLRVQMEQQLMVSGARRVLFMASKWDGNVLLDRRHCWYHPDHDLRARIVAGWEQFERDLAEYRHEPSAPAPVVAQRVDGFGALSLQVEGRVLASNLDAFRASADAFIARLPRPDQLVDDQDFADADAAAKACADAEGRIKAAKDAALAQMADVDAVLRAADSVAEAIRSARLALEKAVKVEKESRKAELVRDAVDRVRIHYDLLNASLGEHGMEFHAAAVRAAMADAIKGKKALSSMRDAIDAAVADAKVGASLQAEELRARVAALAEFSDFDHLFPDRVQLCAMKSPGDLRNLARARIAEHQQREAARAAAERARAEESAGDVAAPAAVAGTSTAAAAETPFTLADIKSRIHPLSITAEGLESIGIVPKGRLYTDWPRILRALVGAITTKEHTA